MSEADRVKGAATGVSPVDRLWTADGGAIRGVIHGALPNKSNAKKIALVRGRMMMFQDKTVKSYIDQFEDAVWRSTGDLTPLPDDVKLYFKATVYQENMRRDLDVELLPDLFQKFNLLKNDRAIWRKEYQREIDKAFPRVEFEIGVIADQERGT